MADTLNLLPCPFCGAKLHYEVDDGVSYHIHPEGECIFSGSEFNDNHNLALWNRRSTSSVSEGEMKEAVSDFRKAAYEFGKHHEPDDHARMMEAQLRIFTTFRAATKAATPDDAPDLAYAKRLATWLWQNHYRAAAPDWNPLDDLMGVLSQIDNMISGWRAPAEDAREEVPDELRKMLDYIPFAHIRAEAYRQIEIYSARRASSVPAIPGTGRETEKDARRLEKFIDWYLRGGSRSEVHAYGHMERTTREIVLAWLDAAPSHPSEAKAGEDA